MTGAHIGAPRKVASADSTLDSIGGRYGAHGTWECDTGIGGHRRRHRRCVELVARRARRRRQAHRDEDRAGDARRRSASIRQELRRRGREGFRRPHQGRNLSGEPVGLDPAPGRRRAVRRHPMPNRRTGVFGRHRRAFRGAGGARPGDLDGAGPAPRRGSGGAPADAWARRRQRAAWRGAVDVDAVLGHRQGADPASGGLQGQEGPHLRLAIREPWR